MAKRDPRTANGSARRRIKAIWRSRGEPCALCGRPIDYSLGMIVDPITGKRRPHPMSFVVDEVVPVSLGGSPVELSNTQPAHWICNARKGDGRGRAASALTKDALPLPFDDW